MPTQADLEAYLINGVRKDPNESGEEDCVDVPKAAVEFMTGRSWESWGLWGHAGDLFGNWPCPPSSRVYNNPNDPNQLPPRGAFIFWRNGSYGHVAYVRGAGTDYLDLIEADTFVDRPAWARRVGWDYPGLGLPVGWIIPAYTYSAPPSGTRAYTVGANGANYRDQPNTGSRVRQTFPPGAVVTVDAATVGEVVAGQGWWVRGAYTKGWLWMGNLIPANVRRLPVV